MCVWFLWNVISCLGVLTELGGDPMSKQRLKFNMKVMGVQKEKTKEGSQKEKDGLIKETYKEKFVAPELSMITYFMTKVHIIASTRAQSFNLLPRGQAVWHCQKSVRTPT